MQTALLFSINWKAPRNKYPSILDDNVSIPNHYVYVSKFVKVFIRSAIDHDPVSKFTRLYRS